MPILCSLDALRAVTALVTAIFAGLDNVKELKLRKYNATSQTYSDVAGSVLTETTYLEQSAARAAPLFSYRAHVKVQKVMPNKNRY